jgi:hypothetical protein
MLYQPCQQLNSDVNLQRQLFTTFYGSGGVTARGLTPRAKGEDTKNPSPGFLERGEITLIRE